MKVKHPSLDIYKICVAVMKINNINVVLRTRIKLLSSFIYIFFAAYFFQVVFLLYHTGLFYLNIDYSDSVDNKNKGIPPPPQKKKKKKLSYTVWKKSIHADLAHFDYRSKL